MTDMQDTRRRKEESMDFSDVALTDEDLVRIKQRMDQARSRPPEVSLKDIPVLIAEIERLREAQGNTYLSADDLRALREVAREQRDARLLKQVEDDAFKRIRTQIVAQKTEIKKLKAENNLMDDASRFFEGKYKEKIEELRRERMDRSTLTAGLDQEYERHTSEYKELESQMDKLKEEAAIYQRDLSHKDTEIANLATKIQFGKNKTAAWRKRVITALIILDMTTPYRSMQWKETNIRLVLTGQELNPVDHLIVAKAIVNDRENKNPVEEEL